MHALAFSFPHNFSVSIVYVRCGYGKVMRGEGSGKEGIYVYYYV